MQNAAIECEEERQSLIDHEDSQAQPKTKEIHQPLVCTPSLAHHYTKKWKCLLVTCHYPRELKKSSRKP